MVEELYLEFRFKKIDETRNYLLDEVKHNDLMIEKYMKTFKYLNYVKHLLILVTTVTVPKIFIPTAELVIPTGIATNEANAET